MEVKECLLRPHFVRIVQQSPAIRVVQILIAVAHKAHTVTALKTYVRRQMVRWANRARRPRTVHHNSQVSLVLTSKMVWVAVIATSKTHMQDCHVQRERCALVALPVDHYHPHLFQGHPPLVQLDKVNG